MGALPDFVNLNAYRRYKQDTDIVATWLATTAEQLGYSTETLKGTKKVQKSQRLKGKARKLAKEAATQSAATTTASPEAAIPNYTIAVSDFALLAEYISEKQGFLVPGHISGALNRAIKLRKGHNIFYASQTNDGVIDAEEDDKRHQHFVEILEQARDLLNLGPSNESIASASQTNRHTSSQIEDDELVFNNMFQGLNVEEPSDEFLNAPAKPMAATPSAIYHVDSSADTLDLYLAIAALLHDLASIRNAIQQIWSQYAQGQISLISASVTTNTAIQLAGQLEEQFIKDYPAEKDTGLAREKFLKFQYMMLGEDFRANARPGESINVNRYDLVDFTLTNTRLILRGFGKVCKDAKGAHPLFKNGFFGVYNPLADRSKMTGFQKFDEDKILLLEMMPDILLFVYQWELTGCDEFTRKVYDFCKNYEESLLLDFVAQIFLLIHHTLRERVGMAWKTFSTYARNCEDSIKESMAFHNGQTNPNWPQEYHMMLREWARKLGDIVLDNAIQTDKNRHTINNGWYPEPYTPYQFYINHPWLCGSLLFGTKMEMQELGLGLSNAWGSIKFAAHIYNAARQEKLLEGHWEDMELALRFYGHQNIFVGSEPKQPEDYYRRWCLAMGYSAQNFAKGKRQTQKFIPSSKGPRGQLESRHITPLADQLRFGYTLLDRKKAAPSLETVLKTCFDKVAAAGGNSIAVDDFLKSQNSRTRKHLTKQFSLAELLQIFCAGLVDEELALTFDHFHLHRTAWDVLRDIHKATDADLSQYYGAGYLETESQLPFMIGYIFMTAIDAKKLAGFLLPKKGDVISSKLLAQAAEVFSEMIDSDIGQSEIKVLQDKYSMALEYEE
ncbi:hypothetical protein BT63DRAFT_44738 [Microthyrium microscopicum]|uniref:DUF6604 domain-containing protein n=1 Tax=Microthyrium microscopicum TaxID=703497 RepID=A0A6A6U0Y3_9PEZI|nr:hypothetical protein BT63DRAFT_44738 [Microthyrium microscopicum]